MTKADIIPLIDLLPKDSVYFTFNGVGPDRPSRLALGLNDPKIGWNFLRALREAALRLPTAIDHPQLIQAAAYLDGAEDESMIEALTLIDPQNATTRYVLQGLLAAPDVTLESIANWMKFPTNVIRIFDQLFFNVRDRLDEPAYVLQLLNPNGIQLARAGDSEELILLRAGAMNGAREVIKLGRIKPDGGQQSLDKGYVDFERKAVAAGSLCLHYGGQKELSSPEVSLAKALAIAHKRLKGDQPETKARADALMEVTPYRSVLASIQEQQQPDIDLMVEIGKTGQPKPGPGTAIPKP